MLKFKISLLFENNEQCAVGDFPVEFEALVDKEILFKVQVKIENVKKNCGPCTVLQLVDDATLVSTYKKCHEAPQDSDFYSKRRCPRLMWMVEKIRRLVIKFVPYKAYGSHISRIRRTFYLHFKKGAVE